jgi:hypothetical protein
MRLWSRGGGGDGKKISESVRSWSKRKNGMKNDSSAGERRERRVMNYYWCLCVETFSRMT